MGITQRWKDIKTSYKAGTSPAKSPKQDTNLRRLEISGLARTVKNECFFWPSDTIWVSQTMGCRLGGVKFEFGPTAQQFAEPSPVQSSPQGWVSGREIKQRAAGPDICELLSDASSPKSKSNGRNVGPEY